MSKLEEKYQDDGEPIDIEEWAEQDDEDTPYDDIQMVAPRILPGQEDRQHWQAETAYGLMATTAEGAFGKILKKRALASRTDEERFGDNVVRAAREAELPNSVRDSVLKLIPLIPDIRYKSAAGMLFGFAAYKYIGKKLTASEKKEFDKIMEKVQIVKDKTLKISELDVVRYAKLIKRIGINLSS